MSEVREVEESDKGLLLFTIIAVFLMLIIQWLFGVGFVVEVVTVWVPL